MKLSIYYPFLTVVLLNILLWYHLSAWYGSSDVLTETLDVFQLTTIPSLVSKNLIDKHSQSGLRYKPPPSLSKDLIRKIKMFVLFIGNERSGSSIVGALMNAHPHMAIAHEYYVFRKWPKEIDITSDNWTSSLYNSLYHKSRHRFFEGKSKGYTLSVKGLWQGKIDEYLSVIGDKGAGSMLKQYRTDKEIFLKKYYQLKNKILIPIRFIHTIRNPFDHIATLLLYHVNRRNKSAVYDMKTRAASSSWKYDNQNELEVQILDFFVRFEAVMVYLEERVSMWCIALI